MDASLQMKTCAERRREARWMKDPHHKNPFRRFYLGPSPVSASAAANVAQAIAEDIKVEKPRAIGVAGRDGRVVSGKPSLEFIATRNASQATTKDFAPSNTPSLHRARSAEGVEGRAGRSFSPMTNKMLSPLKIPDSNRFPAFRRGMSREASFTSARSMPDSVLSEGDLPMNQSTGSAKPKGMTMFRSNTNAAVIDLADQDLPLTPVHKRISRRESQSSYEPARDLGRKKLSFEVLSPRERRGRSEGAHLANATPGVSILQKDHQSTPTRNHEKLLDVPSHEAGPSQHGTPTRSAPFHARYPLRNQTSQRSLAAASRSSMVIHAVDENGPADESMQVSSPVKDTAATKRSDPQSGSMQPEPDTSVNFDTSRAAALKSLKAKAREKYSQTRIGQASTRPLSATQPSRLAHSRDVSRQSRMSRASTAGTIGSVGTRFSEGSFGATGGFRAKLAMKLGRKTSKLMEESARKVKLEKQRHSRGSSSVSGGVVPGAVGTSAGGTKWVGQTFEVGKRFWQVIETREEELRDAKIEEEDEGSSLIDDESRTRASERHHEGNRGSQIQSPDDVLETFARQAQVGSNEHEDEAKSRKSRSRARSVESLREKRREKIQQANLDLKADAVEEDKEKIQLPKHFSSESRTAAAEIENRRGWNDVVSFMSSAKETEKKAFRSRKGEVVSAQDPQQPAPDTMSRADASTIGEAMSVHTALEMPQAPMGVEDQFAQATFELTRRNSNPGQRPAGETDDAASDHEVATKPVTQSPGLLTPLDAHSASLLGGSKDNRTRTISSNSWDARAKGSSPPTSSAPLLRKMASAGDLLTSRRGNGAVTSILNDSSVGLDSQNKKTVQFQGGSGATPPMSRLGTALFPSRSVTPKINEGKLLVGGRVRSVAQGDAAPAPPEEVLSRNASLEGATPPGAHSPYGGKAESGETMITRRSILRRDRMLVKLAWTPSEDLPKLFGERESRQYPIYADSFKEYMVVYRTGRLELWEDPSLVSKVLGHGEQLKLHVAASLRRGRAFVSMYSHIDSIFCLTFTKDDDSHHRLLPLRRSGTCIWIFDARTMSVASDWMWELWRELGGQLPDHIDVHFSALSVRVRIPIPDEVAAIDSISDLGSPQTYLEGGEGFKLLSRGYVKKIIRKVVEAQPEWRQLCQSTEIAGLQFELAWRSESTLDWVREDVAATGQRRDWSVLVGSILSSAKKPATLEYRPASHYPTSVRSGTGEMMQEPPGVEGFLWRVKAVSGALTRLYVTTHDGLIFVNRSSKSFPPDRHLATLVDETAYGISGMSRFAASAANDQIEQERRRKRDAIRGRKRAQAKEETLSDLRSQVLSTLTALVSTEEEIDAQIDAYRAFEKRRQFEQISNTDGYVDVRDIVLIRSMAPNGMSHQPSADGKQGKSTEHLNGDAAPPFHTANGHADHDDGKPADTTAAELEEEEDLGGEEGLALARDRVAMKTARQFEVTLSNGRSIRFEAYSKSVAEEWITRIASLSQYWKRREKVDALEIMLGSGLDPGMIGRYVHGRRSTAAARNLQQAKEGQELSTVLGGIWNWCIYDSCRGILRSGRLFQKKKAFSGFYSRYYILIAGRLLHFKLMTSNSTARARQNSGIFHKRQETVVHLRDAYVYSGQLTEDMLVNGRSEGAGAINRYGSGSGGGTAASSASRHTLPRVYGDGLLSVDDDEDCTFIIRYRPQRVNMPADPIVEVKQQEQQPLRGDAATSVAEQTSSTTRPAPVSSAPKLNDATYNHLVLRARCKLERDLWVRAINVECERLSREDREREEKIRNQGQTPWKVHYNHTSFT